MLLSRVPWGAQLSSPPAAHASKRTWPRPPAAGSAQLQRGVPPHAAPAPAPHPAGPTVATSGLALQVPLAVLLEALLRSPTWLSHAGSTVLTLVGGAVVLVGFFGVNAAGEDDEKTRHAAWEERQAVRCPCRPPGLLLLALPACRRWRCGGTPCSSVLAQTAVCGHCLLRGASELCSGPIIAHGGFTPWRPYLHTHTHACCLPPATHAGAAAGAGFRS